MTDIEFEPTEATDPDDLELPPRLPVLPLKETVVFPDSATPLAIGQERSIKLIDDVVARDRLLALVTVKSEDVEQPGWDDLYGVGTAAIVHKLIKVPDGTLRILVQGVERIRLEGRVQDDPYFVGEFEQMPDVAEETPELEALTRNVQMLYGRIVAIVPYLPAELELAAANVDDPSALSYLVASTLRLKTEEKQQLLEQPHVEARLRDLSRILNRELEVFELGTKIQSQVQSEMEKGQREFFLRQQMKAIQEELGEGDPEQAEIRELRERVETADLPEETRKAVDRELARLERLPAAAAEYGVIRTYIDWILSLPWSQTTEDNLDLPHARQVLDEDHFDLEKVKERIIEYLAVAKLRGDVSGSILCFVGPPGVGKTSLGQSIARALERKYTRISVGGVHDESEIRGHRRTYIGAMPGTIIRALRDAESRNPVFLIDEIDKMGSDFRGDPASAMLEVLDPEQHSTFRDHYLDLPFDLSKVLFICTANQLETIPGPLLDRMDVIQLSGYTEDEKLGIAKRYLVPKQLEAHGLKADQVELHRGGASHGDPRVHAGGGRQEPRAANRRALPEGGETRGRGEGQGIDAASTSAARGRGSGRDASRVRFGSGPRIPELPPAWRSLRSAATSSSSRRPHSRAAAGSRSRASSARSCRSRREAALSWVRSHAEQVGIDPEWFSENDIHVHVPAGAVPKDGPSAGITMVTAIVSLVTGRPVSDDVAMTGEVTLTGQVLPIGGVREKVLAAQRAGVHTVVLPSENEPDLEDLPAETRKGLEFVLAEHVDEVLEAALDGATPSRRPSRVGSPERKAALPAEF